MNLEAVFLEHLELIERAAQFAARRAGFSPQDIEDFVSTAKVKLIDDDYGVLRKYRGDRGASLGTYLTLVVKNACKDYCNHKWGKFRPSAIAKKLGPTALALERLLVCEQHDESSAIEILKGRYEVEASRDELREIASQLPVRIRPRDVGDEVLENRPSPSPEASAERRVEDGERSATAARVEEVLNLALESLGAQDLLILKMLFRDSCRISTVASALHLEQRPLYSRRDKCLRALREAFEIHGLTWDEVREILGWQGREVRADFARNNTEASV